METHNITSEAKQPVDTGAADGSFDPIGRLMKLKDSLFTEENGKAKLRNVKYYPGHALFWAVALGALAKAKPLTLGLATGAGVLIVVFDDQLPEQAEFIQSWPRRVHNIINSGNEWGEGDSIANVQMLAMAAVLASAMRYPRVREMFPTGTGHIFQHGVATVAGLSISHYILDVKDIPRSVLTRDDEYDSGATFRGVTTHNETDNLADDVKYDGTFDVDSFAKRSATFRTDRSFS